MRRMGWAIGLAVVAAGCGGPAVTVGLGAPPAGGGGGGVGGELYGAPAGPGGRITLVACPIDFADQLARAIADVTDRRAHDALEVQRIAIDRLGGASETARRQAVAQLQTIAWRLERQGGLSAEQATVLADLAACYLR